MQVRILGLITALLAVSCGGEPSGLAFDPRYTWPTSPLNVCFDNGSSWQKTAVKTAVAQTWGTAPGLDLTWMPCGRGGFQEVHVEFGSVLYIDGLGVSLNRLAGGIALSDPSEAVFAFGFVLGFVAGQDRGDTECQAPRRFSNYDVERLGPWDETSVMNECRPSGVLSKGDVAGVRVVYH